MTSSFVSSQGVLHPKFVSVQVNPVRTVFSNFKFGMSVLAPCQLMSRDTRCRWWMCKAFDLRVAV